MNPLRERTLFLKGLLFVGLAYALIKVIDHYPLFLEQLSQLQTAIMPFVMAFVFAYFFNPLLKWLHQHTRWSRGILLTIIYLTFLLLCVIGTSIISPMIYQNTSDLIKQIPNFATKLQEQVTHWSQRLNHLELGEFNAVKTEVLTFVPQLTEMISNSLTSLLTWMYGAVLGTGNALFGFVLSIYILLEKESIIEITKRFFKLTLQQQAPRVFSLTKLLHENIGKYLMGKFLDSMILGSLVGAGIVIFGGQYAVLLAVMFTILNMIPFVGPIIGMVIVTGIHLFYSPVLGLTLFVYIFILQQFEALVIEPKIVGQHIGLNPLLTLLAVTLGGKLLGVPGMILGVPLMAVFKQYAVSKINQTYEQCYATLTEEPTETPENL